jgi:hypothetical protein
MGFHVRAAQLAFIRPRLGSEFYDELVFQYSTSTLSPPNAFIRNEYIISALSAYLSSVAIRVINSRVSNAGVTQPQGANVIAANEGHDRAISTEYANAADEIMNEMHRYIIANKSLYPLYKFCENQNFNRIIGVSGINSITQFH